MVLSGLCFKELYWIKQATEGLINVQHFSSSLRRRNLEPFIPFCVCLYTGSAILRKCYAKAWRSRWRAEATRTLVPRPLPNLEKGMVSPECACIKLFVDFTAKYSRYYLVQTRGKIYRVAKQTKYMVHILVSWESDRLTTFWVKNSAAKLNSPSSEAHTKLQRPVIVPLHLSALLSYQSQSHKWHEVNKTSHKRVRRNGHVDWL